jgi:hypothetical protein
MADIGELEIGDWVVLAARRSRKRLVGQVIDLFNISERYWDMDKRSRKRLDTAEIMLENGKSHNYSVRALQKMHDLELIARHVKAEGLLEGDDGTAR